ncbi:MAG: HAMP domain-containing histidine kinase [Hymenobacteraceae bacterium]|nr:HAMP domain-containing histidine kinase [Hymenobacteraceae bacterium]MDX5396297.1 HAMP domain-containing histidine kinase [Hymenobacteraceae bacterium]MDX5443052.1 HAMP domain-containing histidine kinase [Hymenobacteraceae bacterium]MDX5512356.1 HAMP domain-containing histidine kinase [Hymenobacteraceae bacterium]
MKLLNHTTTYFAATLLVIMTVWAAIFYFAMLDEIYDSMDDGLDNQRLLVLQKAARDSSVLHQTEFEDGYYKITEIPVQKNALTSDTYLDTLMYMQNEDEYEPIRMLKTVFRHNEKYYELRVITSMVEEDDLIAELVEAMIWLYVGLIISVLLLNNFLLKKVWKPFYKLLRQLQQFRLDKPQQLKPTHTTVDEFILLNETVQKLLQSNISTYNNQKQFIENASHELQTPLAISLNKLELLAESQNLTDAQLQTLAAAINNLERLTRLNKSLLLLSKIENHQFAEESEVDLGKMCENLMDDFTEQAVYRQVKLSLQEECPCIRKMNPDLALILLTNLIKNAIVHNQPQGLVHVFLNKEMLQISNSGDTTPLDEAIIFNRFYKGSRSGQSHGLGLAIVKAIADLYHFNIRYSYQQKHIITLHF